MRCNSAGDLYPLTNTSSAQASPPFAALARTLWHSRLGHPSSNIICSLRKNNFISCNERLRSFFCQSCALGKQVKLPFYDSTSFTSFLFDIVHGDIWTSSIVSSLGLKYYVLLYS